MELIMSETPVEQWYVEWANTLDSTGKDSSDARDRLAFSGIIGYMSESMMMCVKAARHADCLKKHLFYGRSIHQFDDYELTQLTVPGIYERMNDHNFIRLLHAVLGLFDEAGELMQALFEYAYLDKPIDPVNLTEEFGDVMWYLALGAKYLRHEDFSMIMLANYAKLVTRYPDGAWSQVRALNRDLGAEHTALEESSGKGTEPKLGDEGGSEVEHNKGH